MDDVLFEAELLRKRVEKFERKKNWRLGFIRKDRSL
jgi:hypothetical protein